MYRPALRFAFVLFVAAATTHALNPQAMARGGGGHGGGHGGRHGGGHHAAGHHAAGHHAGNHPGNHARAHHGAHDLSHHGYHHGGYAGHGGWGGYGGYGYGWGHRGWGGYGLAAGLGYGLGYWGAAPVGYPATSAYAVPVPAYGGTDASADDLATNEDDSASDGDNVNDDNADDAATSAGPVDPAQSDSGEEANENEEEYAVTGDHTRTDNRAAIHVFVPAANATIQFNGEQLTGTGRDRMILTPVIEPGQEFRFQIKASWTDQGKEIRETRAGRTTAGAQVRADFTQPAGEHNPTSLVPTKRQVVPEDSTGDGQTSGESAPAPEDFVPAGTPATASAP